MSTQPVAMATKMASDHAKWMSFCCSEYLPGKAPDSSARSARRSDMARGLWTTSARTMCSTMTTVSNTPANQWMRSQAKRTPKMGNRLVPISTNMVAAVSQ